MLNRDDLRLFQGVQAVAMLRYFLRLYDRTDGATNLFPHVPKIARTLASLLNGDQGNTNIPLATNT